jgi:hypothetical protein
VHGEVRPWYAIPMMVFGFVALVYGVKRLLGQRPIEGWTKNWLCILLFLQVMINVTSYPYWTHLWKKEASGDFPRNYVTVLDKVVKLIPQGATIIGPIYLYSHFHKSSYHDIENYYNNSQYRYSVEPEYVILDERKARRVPVEMVSQLKKKIVHDPRYRLVFQEKEISVYQRTN